MVVVVVLVVVVLICRSVLAAADVHFVGLVRYICKDGPDADDTLTRTVMNT